MSQHICLYKGITVLIIIQSLLELSEIKQSISLVNNHCCQNHKQGTLFYFHFHFLLFSILGLRVRVKVMSHITITNCHTSVIVTSYMI